MIADDTRVMIVMQEKDHWRSELLDYNKRLDRTVVLYITAGYAAVGLRVSGQLDLSSLRDHDDYVWLVFLFIFLNASILLHGLAQSCWTMAISKFIHLKVDGELLAILGNKTPRDDCKQRELPDVDVLGWDDWRTELKGVAVALRSIVVLLWCLLILLSSVCSLAFVRIPHFLHTHMLSGTLAIIVLIILHGIAFYQAVSYVFCLTGGRKDDRYHKQRVSFSGHDRFWIGCFAIVGTVLLTLAGVYTATLYQ